MVMFFIIVRSQEGGVKAIPHNSKCRYGERGAADAKPKAQIILDAAKVSAASGGNSEPKQGQRSQSARGFCPRSTMRVPQPDIIEHFGNADAVPQLPERCLSRKAGIVRCCLWFLHDPGGEILRKTRHVGQRASRPTRIFNVCMQLQHVLWGTVLTAPIHWGICDNGNCIAPQNYLLQIKT